MHDAELNVGLGVNNANGIGKTGEPVTAEHQDVLDATSFQIVENLDPEACSLSFFDPQSEHFLPAGDADAQYVVHAFLQHAFFGSYGNPKPIIENYRVYAIQRARLPIRNLLMELLCGSGHKLGGEISIP